MIIEIASASDETVLKIQKYLAVVARLDPKFNGVNFDLRRGDFTQIPNDDSEDACTLLACIQSIIRGDKDE